MTNLIGAWERYSSGKLERQQSRAPIAFSFTLVEPAVYSQSFESEPYFRNTAEKLCLGDECVGVTTAVYLRTTATDEDFRFALSHVLNLVPFVDDPSIDEAFRQNCRLGTPELWCDQLLEGTE